MKLVIADASPLILLAKLDLLELLCNWFKVEIPEEVSLESTFRIDLPDAKIIQGFIDTKRILIKKVPFNKVTVFQKEWGLGKGEAAVILLAISKQSVIVTDDYSAMRVAKIHHCPFVTTPVLIVEMARQKILDVKLAHAKLEAIKNYAWISSEIMEKVKNSLFEKGGE